MAGIVALLLATFPCFAQNQPQSSQLPADNQTQLAPANSTVTVPAGTHIALVLTQPIETRYLHRGDDIYAQINAPVSSDAETVIPPGTFVQGKVDKLARRGDRGELRLASMAITFPDGYVATVPGPITLESSNGYALKDPGSGRFASTFLLPAAGAGIGALIGYAAANKSPSTLTASIPPGCTGPPPGCVSSSTSVPAHTGMSIGIGAGVGAAVGMIASFLVLGRTRDFFLEAGAPVEMALQQPLTLQQAEVAKAARQSGPAVSIQPVAPLPLPLYPFPDISVPPSTMNPPLIIPGAPGPNGVPGPPIIIPQ